MNISSGDISSSAVRKISDVSGANLLRCYQCGKCSAGCPMAEHMDLLPHQVMRLAQLGQIQEIASARSPFICAACLACSVRCPRGIPIAEVMEAVRQVVLRERITRRHFPLSPEDLSPLPPIAIISAFRKIME